MCLCVYAYTCVCVRVVRVRVVCVYVHVCVFVCVCVFREKFCFRQTIAPGILCISESLVFILIFPCFCSAAGKKLFTSVVVTVAIFPERDSAAATWY